MKRIPLRTIDRATVRAWALVSDSDFAWLGRWRWCLSGGYVTRHERIGEHRGRKRRTIKMHRQILGLEFGDPREGEHRNRNPLDNQRSNLRVASRASKDNHQNRGPRRDSKSGYRGVHYYPRLDRWTARVQLDGKKHFLGYHDTPEQADAICRLFRAENMPFSEEATP